MNQMIVRTKLRSFIKDKKGANLVEYIILVGVIALIALAGYRVFGQNVQAKVSDQAGQVSGI